MNYVNTIWDQSVMLMEPSVLCSDTRHCRSAPSGICIRMYYKSLSIPSWTLKNITGIDFSQHFLLDCVISGCKFKEFLAHCVKGYFLLLLWKLLASVCVISLSLFTECSLLRFYGNKTRPNIDSWKKYMVSLWSFLTSTTIYDRPYHPIQFNWVFSVF